MKGSGSDNNTIDTVTTISYSAIPSNDVTGGSSTISLTDSNANRQKSGEELPLSSSKNGFTTSSEFTTSWSSRFPRIELAENERVNEEKRQQQSIQRDEQRGNYLEEEIISVDDVIETIGVGHFQLRILIASGLSFSADSMEILLLSFLSMILQDQWDLSPNQTASITACVFAGAFVGTLILGPLGDRIGRRPVFLLGGIIISFFGLTTALSRTFEMLLLNRFWVGFGVGGLTVPFDILAEFLPTSARGKNLSCIEFFWTAGSMSVPLVAYITVGSGRSWQLFVMVCAVPCLASVIYGSIYVPESPRWLISCGRSKEALEILKQAATVNGKDIDVLFPKGVVLKDEREESSNFGDLFKPKWRKLTVNLWGVFAGYAIGYYGTIIAVARVFERVEDDMDSSETTSNESGVDFDYSAIFISSCSEIIGTIIVLLFVDRVGRVPLQVYSYISSGICFFVLCFFATSDKRGLLMCFAFMLRVFEMSGNCATWLSITEVLSTEIRSTGHSAANAVARLGAFSSPFLVEGSISLRKVGTIMLAIHVLTAYCASHIPETKDVSLGEKKQNKVEV